VVRRDGYLPVAYALYTASAACSPILPVQLIGQERRRCRLRLSRARWWSGHLEDTLSPPVRPWV